MITHTSALFKSRVMLLLLVPHSGILEAAENPYGEDDSKSPFPVQPPVKRSYALNVSVWIKASGLQVRENLCMHATFFF